MTKNNFLSILFCFIVLTSIAQKSQVNLPFSVRLEQVQINELPALQSFAFATWQGKWLLVGGRKDGLHRRQPWAGFDDEGQNKFIYVVDPIRKQVWKKSLQELPANIQEQLQSTNMQFFQIENKLILTGGYGYSKTEDDHITYPYLTIIRVEEAIHAIMNNKNFINSITQVKDQRMAITGGRLAKIGNTLILAGGQRFDGRYNPMGPEHGPGFVQQYSNEIRKFTLNLVNNVPAVANYRTIKDTVNLHRRDYNLVPQIFKNNELGFAMYSGVFQYNKDLPFTNFVDILEEDINVNNSFEQKLSHYHSAVMPMYDKTTSAMYSIFFGGIAQYYPDSLGKLIPNNDVPFTKTISVVSRINNNVVESYLPIQMPGYLGAAAEFIFVEGAKLYKEGIADMSVLQNDEVFIGYIVGGINSRDKNIFWSNTGKESKANNTILKVYIKRIN